MHRLKSLILIMLVVIAGTGCQKEKILETEVEEVVYDKNKELPDMDIYHSSKKGIFCVIQYSDAVHRTLEPLVIPDKYFVNGSSYAGRRYHIKDRRYRIYEVDKYTLNIFDIHTLEKVKTLDMLALLSPYMEEWQIYGAGVSVGEHEGKYYLTKSMERKLTRQEIEADVRAEFKDIWIDIENEKVAPIEKENKPLRGDSENLRLLAGTLILRANNYGDIFVYNSEIIKDTSFISIPTSRLPKKNEKLYSLFPELKNVSREEGLYAYIYLYPQTNDLEALSLIMEEGERLDFSALKPERDGYYGSYGKNGQIHYITKEEYEEIQRDYYEHMEQQEEVTK